MATRPTIEFADGSRQPFEIVAADVTVGRDPSCGLHVDAPGVAPRHARVGAQPGGAFIEDLGTSRSGTLVNGQRIAGRVTLTDGATIEIGAAALTFRGGAPAAKAPVQEQATMIAGELPESVKQALAARNAAKPAAPAKPAPVAARPTPAAVKPVAAKPAAKPAPASPANLVVGKPDATAAEENRTMQMDAPDFAALGLAVPAKPAAPPRSTVQGMPQAPKPPAPATKALMAPASNVSTPFDTVAEMQAPSVPPARSAPNPFESGVAPPANPMGMPPAPSAPNPFGTQADMGAPQQANAPNPFSTVAEMGAPQQAANPFGTVADMGAPALAPGASPPAPRYTPASVQAQPQQRMTPGPMPQARMTPASVPQVPSSAPTAFLEAPNLPPTHQPSSGPSTAPVKPLDVGAMFSASQTNDVIRQQDKAMLVLSYLGLLSLIPFFTVKDSEYVQWHAKQGLAFTIVAVALTIVMTILSVVFALVLPILATIFGLLMLLVDLGLLAVVIIAIIQAFKPARWKIPVVSMVAEKVLGQRN